MALFTALLILLAFAAEAQATPRWQVERQLDVAEEHFGSKGRCPDGVEVRWYTTPRYTSSGKRVPAYTWFACQVLIDGPWYEKASWDATCSTTVHEYGHAAMDLQFPDNETDPSHSLDPHDVMYAGYKGWPFQPCINAYPHARLSAHLRRLIAFSNRLESICALRRGVARRGCTVRLRNLEARTDGAWERLISTG